MAPTAHVRAAALAALPMAPALAEGLCPEGDEVCIYIACHDVNVSHGQPGTACHDAPSATACTYLLLPAMM